MRYRHGKYRLKITGLVWICLLFNIHLVFAQTAQTNTSVSKEYQIKAAFLFNFTQFVEWPATAFSAPNAPFVIGILGDDPFGAAIDEAVNGEKIGLHPLIVQRYHDSKEIKPCHILFISSADPERIKESLALMSTHTLTVSDAGSFMKMGGIIRFFTERNKIRLQINPDAARLADLNISAKLLRVSDIFDPKSQPK
jgi:preprotein translocase subunit Sec61beta